MLSGGIPLTSHLKCVIGPSSLCVSSSSCPTAWNANPTNIPPLQRPAILLYPLIPPSACESIDNWLRGQDTHLCLHYRPRYPHRDTIYPRPVQSLPSLRDFLRNEGIETDIEPRQPCRIDATHENAREDARRRAIRSATTRYGFPGHAKAQSHRLPSVLGRVQFWNALAVLLSMDNRRF